MHQASDSCLRLALESGLVVLHLSTETTIYLESTDAFEIWNCLNTGDSITTTLALNHPENRQAVSFNGNTGIFKIVDDHQIIVLNPDEQEHLRNNLLEIIEELE